MTVTEFKPIKYGLLFCIGQAFIEANVAFIIILVLNSSIINYEGLLFYFFIRTLLTIVPYVFGFYFCNRFLKKFIPAVTSFFINLLVLTFFAYFGLIKIDIFSMTLASILTSVVLIIIDYKFNSKYYLNEKENAAI